MSLIFKLDSNYVSIFNFNHNLEKINSKINKPEIRPAKNLTNGDAYVAKFKKF